MDNSHFEQQLMIFLQSTGENATTGTLTIMQGDSEFKIRKTLPIDIATDIHNAFLRISDIPVTS